jgi:class 3 adenylate cyclase/tetratricopeptide (TPR) repeat protein
MAVCQACGRENPEGFRFCGFCTAPLDQAAVPVAEERKVISVLFCDLVGFTASSDEADPEDVRARLRPYHGRLRHEIERFGGTVEKFAGDAVMAVFGVPAAHEDDAERAVRAGLRILEAIEDLNERDAGLGFSVRIGITTGEAVVAVGPSPDHGEGILADVVNTAARLQSAAPVGAVVVGEPTFLATSDVFDYQALAPVSVKGKARPVALWRAGAARARFGTDITRAHTAPLVGRKLEQTLLRGIYERAVRDTSVQLVTIVGEPGIGKSRLVVELLDHLDTRSGLVTWRQGRCLPYGEGITFWALGEIVKAQAGILESDTPDQAAAKLDAAVPAGEPDREWLRRRLLPLVGVEPSSPASREEAFTAWRRFFESIAADRPAVLVFEDLHWADEALLAFLEHLADWSQGVPLLVVCTARPELYERQPGWAGGKRNATTVNLAPLTDEETARLVAALLHATVLPVEVQALLVERAGGNPLYAEEFVRMLADRRLLVRTKRTLQLGDGVDVPFPDTVQALIAARLDTLSHERKALLQDAAVLGKVFWTGALCRMGGGTEAVVGEALHELSRKELVRPVRASSMTGQAEHTFRHMVVRDVAYAQIPRPARAAKHLAAAAWMEEQAGGRVEDLAELLAHHHLQALELTRAGGDAGQATGQLAERARVALRDAGDRSFALNAFGAAARWYRAALDLWPAGDPGRPRLLLGLGTALFHAQESGDQELADASAALLAAGDREGAAEAEVLLARLTSWRGAQPTSLEHTRRAAALLDDAGPSPAKALALANLAADRMLAGDNAEAIRVGTDALALVDDLGLDGLRPRALSCVGTARLGVGDLGGIGDLERAVAESMQLTSPDSVVAYINLASALIELGELPRGFQLQAEGLRMTERFGFGSYVRHLVAERVIEDYWRGRWDAAARVADEFVAESEAGTRHQVETSCRQVRGSIRLARGDLPAALEDAAKGLALAREVGDPPVLDPLLAFHARASLAAGRVEEADAHVSELLQVLADQAVAMVGVPTWTADLAVVLGALGRGGELAAATGAMVPTPWLRAATALAVDDFERAADGYAQIGSLPDEAFARLRAAERLLGAGQRATGGAQLQRALALFRQVGATAYLRQGAALVAASA